MNTTEKPEVIAPESFHLDNLTLRSVGKDGVAEVVTQDLGDILGIQNVRDAVADFPEDEKGVVLIYTLGGVQKVTTLFEPGIYRLIFRSRKAVAEKMRRWVFHDVLPSIRKTGGYHMLSGCSASANLQQLTELRATLLRITIGQENNTISPGKAQAAGITAMRFMEALKIEIDAHGYENVLGLPPNQTPQRVLPSRQRRPRGSDSELLPDLPQPAVPSAPGES